MIERSKELLHLRSSTGELIVKSGDRRPLDYQDLRRILVDITSENLTCAFETDATVTIVNQFYQQLEALELNLKGDAVLAFDGPPRFTLRGSISKQWLLGWPIFVSFEDSYDLRLAFLGDVNLLKSTIRKFTRFAHNGI